MITAVGRTTELASSAVTAWAVVFGIVIVGVLLLAFWWGARSVARRRAPSRAPQQRAGSWHEPQESETRHSARTPHDDEHG
jgi:protein-S-isoprenylcysteine O-methyltransferase Ste14